VTAYTLGLRHAFDADHISAIDNTTRKAMNQRQGTTQPRPFGFGYCSSLGHSTIVVAIGVGIITAAKTVLPAAICIFIGGIETLSLVPLEVHGVSQTSGFWGFMYNFDINTAGFVIVGMFIVTWAAAILIWHFGHIEERWTARLQTTDAGTPGTELT
jgi:high-affinity nickel permease